VSELYVRVDDHSEKRCEHGRTRRWIGKEVAKDRIVHERSLQERDGVANALNW